MKENKKNSKGIIFTVIGIVLALVIGLFVGLLVMFVITVLFRPTGRCNCTKCDVQTNNTSTVDCTKCNVTTNNDSANNDSTETKKIETICKDTEIIGTGSSTVSGEDTSVFLASSYGYLYGYLDNGTLYYQVYTTDKKDNYFDSYYKHGEFITYDGITNIKRIKIFNLTTGAMPDLYIITDDGKVYSTFGISYKSGKIHSGYDGTNEGEGFLFREVSILKDYAVEDIISAGKFHDIYTVLLKDGSTKEVGEYQGP